MDIAHGYHVERDLERLIEKRAAKGEVEPDEAEPGYIESVRVYRERSAAEMRRRWVEFHRHLRQLHSALAEEHAHKAEQLCEGRGEGRR